VILNLLPEIAGVVRVACQGNITQEKISRDSDPLQAAAGGPEVYGRTVLLNLEQADYIDSSGISWLLVCHKRCTQLGGRLITHSVPPAVMKMLEIVQMPRIMTFAADEAAALSLATKG
jgi:anti-anti-sigma factor